MADATIIMAGGVGTRLWPASLLSQPKQLLRIGSGESLIQQAVRRADAISSGPIIIVTHADHVESIAAHVAELADNPLDSAPRSVTPLSSRVVYLPEPVGRNTAPAIALGMRYVEQALGADATAIVLTADHVIGPLDLFSADAERAVAIARKNRLVCFGIRPSRPETGYGYIEAGEPFNGGNEVISFKEKPDASTAGEYVSRGNFYWNSGMFGFQASHFFRELSAHAPYLASPFAGSALQIDTTIFPDGSSRANAEDFADIYADLTKISIDYALLEKSSSVAVIPAEFSWNDVGSWDEIAALASTTDTSGRTVIEVEANGNFVDSELPVAICGVSGVHVIVRNGMVLVCKRGSSQLVKQVVESAKAAERDDLV